MFYRNTPILPNDEILVDIFEQGAQLLKANGFVQYEVSAWSRQADFQSSQHNLNYWQFGDYLAIGAGAHGKVTRPDGIYRFSKSRLPKDYRVNQSAIGWQAIEPSDLPFEFMMNGLRLKNGVPKQFWTQRTGLAWSVIEPQLIKLHNRGLVELSGDHIHCTAQGFLFLNQVLQEFLPDD